MVKMFPVELMCSLGCLNTSLGDLQESARGWFRNGTYLVHQSSNASRSSCDHESTVWMILR